MKTRLAGGLIPSAGTRVWPGDAAPGVPVVVGPETATESHVRAALAALEALIGAGGALAAGANADLGHGFHSALVEGGAGGGDRRDAVLAALTTDLSRLGPLDAVPAALFGPGVTKRVAAAAWSAVDDGRLPVLKLATAAADLLGPEQLERILALGVPEDTDPFGAAGVGDVARNLDRLLGGLPARRRHALLTGLWQRACAGAVATRTLRRLRRTQGGGDPAWLTEMYRRLDDRELLGGVHRHLGRNPTRQQLVRWQTPPWIWRRRARRLFADARAVTVLAAIAEDAVTEGLPTALDRHRPALAEVHPVRRIAARDLWGMPVFPAEWVEDFQRRLGNRRLTPKLEAYLAARLARTRDWGVALLAAADDFFGEVEQGAARRARDVLDAWGHTPMTRWRAAAGYFSPARPPAALERIADRVWLAELGDRVARLHGLPSAAEDFSVAASVTGAARLAECGGVVPRRPRSWAELVDGLAGTAAVAEVLTGAFPVPPELLARDGATVPGTGLRVEVGRNARQIAEWGAYMGNCVGSTGYRLLAEDERCVLLALRAPDGRIVLNADLVRTPGGWQIGDLKARFNESPDRELGALVHRWVQAIRPAVLRAGSPARRGRPAAGRRAPRR